jgi:putative redox protein
MRKRNLNKPTMISEAQLTAVTGLFNYQVVSTASGNTVTGDEPLEKGGRHSGMNPFELLLCSLGTCTAVTLRMYAEHKKWTTGEITVNLHLKSEIGVTEITRSINYSEILSPEQTTRLMQIANSCPVHKILTGTILIRTV